MGFIISSLTTRPSLSDLLDKLNSFILNKYLIAAIILVIMLVFKTKLFVNPSSSKAEIEYYATIGDWERILQNKDKISIEDRVEVNLLNRAFYHTGKMASDMFSFPQVWGEYSLLLKDSNSKTVVWISDLYYDFGFVKAAEYWALESQTFYAYSPHLMKRLASCALLLKEYPMAEKYLTILRKSTIYHPWVDQIDQIMSKGDTTLLTHMLIANKPLNSDTIDYINTGFPEQDLIKLHESNKDSKMVYEYLMSYYLLNNELAKFYDLLPDIRDLNTTQLPPVYQQALLLYDMMKDINPEKNEFAVSRNIRKQFFDFNKIMVDQKDPSQIRDLHNEYFSNTYWYYLRYISPKTLGKEIKTD